jgi:hypothetical protein
MLAEKNWSPALKQEVDELKEYFQAVNSEQDRPEPEYVYHYTSLGTLCKILEGETIRLYDLMDMKDNQEFLHPLRIVSESMTHYWDKLLTKVSGLFQKTDRLAIGDTWHAAIACFCEGAETQYMWNEYADQGRGAAIKCHAPVLRSNPTSHAVYPMIYDDAWFRGMLRRSHEYVVLREWPYRFGFQEGTVIGWQYCEHLLKFLLRVKRECFSQEREWRALKLMDSTDANHRDDRGRRYVTIPLLQEYVSAVVLGPKCPKSEEEIKAFLNTTRYKGAGVSRSLQVI